MRYAAMQFLTWGTVVGVVCSAFLLAALENPELRYSAQWPDATWLLGGAVRFERALTAPMSARQAAAAASAPRPSGR
jgi:hypothetical protein